MSTLLAEMQETALQLEAMGKNMACPSPAELLRLAHLVTEWARTIAEATVFRPDNVVPFVPRPRIIAHGFDQNQEGH